jgi:hypothetical protein
MDQATRLSTAFALTGAILEAHLTELRRNAFTKAGARPSANCHTSSTSSV